MKQNNTSRYAYLAGIVDGEGCLRIDIGNEVTRKNPTYRLRLQIAQKNGKIIDWLYGNFGGSVYKPSPKRTKCIRPNGEIYESVCFDYRWSLTKRENLLPLLKKILPFCIEKKKQIEEGISFIYYLEKYKKGMKKVGNNFIHKEENIENYIQVCDKYYWTLRALKKIHIPSAAVETKLAASSKEEML